MRITRTRLPEICVIEPIVFRDDRGWFTESFNARRFDDAIRAADLPAPGVFVQDNHSCSSKNVLRGIHFQRSPHPQAKLVRVVRGRVFDVAVDLRRSSPRFGRWVGVELSAENGRQLWVPIGFGHGFLALEDDTEVLYKTTDYYHKSDEGTVAWNDAFINIDWPIGNSAPILAERDASAPALSDAMVFD